ncbi:MAG TPA: hypothetical protein VLL08_29620 [Kineosporiaceae bacterium]|nr:hypothetical protein [Kineosporiaceae bacterium]
MLTLQFAAFVGAAVLVPTGVILLGLGLFRSGSTDALESVPDELVPHPIARLVPTDHRSTSTERQECRARLGPSYDAHLVIVADIFARRPAGLHGVLMEARDLPIDDLVTVSAYLTGPRMGLDRALRLGTAEAHRSVVACLVSGLRRFPTYRGACFGVARTVGVPLDVYRPGRTLIEPAFIRAETERAGSWSDGRTSVDTEIVYVFWSRNGRQVGALGTSPGTVMFAAGSKFRVLAVQCALADDGPGVVFLSECAKFGSFARDWPLARFGLLRWWILTRLRREMADEPAKATQAQLRPPAELGFTPGFDQTGRPYREDLSQPVQAAAR